MRQVEFSRRIDIASIRPRLKGLRHQPFTNIDGESFGKPTLGGFWQFEVDLVAMGERDMLALSALLTDMRGISYTLLPLSNQWVPNDNMGRRLTAFLQSPDWTMEHVGWQAQPFDGYKLLNGASARDSYIDVTKPALSHIWPGHYITLGERLHQVMSVSALNESETEARLTIRPGLRESYPQDEIVVVDYLTCRVVMADAEDVALHSIPFQQVGATFVEAFT